MWCQESARVLVPKIPAEPSVRRAPRSFMCLGSRFVNTTRTLVDRAPGQTMKHSQYIKTDLTYRNAKPAAREYTILDGEGLVACSRGTFVAFVANCAARNAWGIHPRCQLLDQCSSPCTTTTTAAPPAGSTWNPRWMSHAPSLQQSPAITPRTVTGAS